jgi:hypothetical protein
METKKLLKTAIVATFGVVLGVALSFSAIYIYEALTFKIDLDLPPAPWF